MNVCGHQVARLRGRFTSPRRGEVGREAAG